MTGKKTTIHPIAVHENEADVLMQTHHAEFLEALSTVVFFNVNENDYCHDSLVQKVKKIKP
ncbi:MAG: hypothetical protein Q6373_013790, partial [Candidatus Sigynarchaeota archaeon]